MSSLADEDPVRAIRNAMERLTRATKGTLLEAFVADELGIIDDALFALEKPAPAEPRKCGECRYTFAADDGVECPNCDLFGAPEPGRIVLPGSIADID